MIIWNLSVFDFILLTDGQRSNPLGLSVSQSIKYVDSATNNQKSQNVLTHIAFTQDIKYHYGLTHRSITDSINFRQLLERGNYQTVHQYINFNERFIKPHDLYVNQSLTLTPVINYPGKLLTHTLTLIDTIHLSIVKDLIITDTLYLINSPQVTEESYNFLGIPPTSLSPNAQVTFTCRANGLTRTVTIKAPDFEDTDELHFQKVQRNTRNNDLIIYRDPIWPVYEVFNLHFSYLLDSDINNLFDFLQFSLGQDVMYTDFEQQTWTGVITTPIGEFSTTGRFNNRAHITFEVN